MVKRQNKTQLAGNENRSSAYKSKADPLQPMMVMKMEGSEPNESGGIVYERADHIHIDFDAIPDCVRDDLAVATLNLLRGILRQPGGREMLDAETAARKARQEARKRSEPK